MLQKKTKQIKELANIVLSKNEHECVVSYWKTPEGINFVNFKNTVILNNLNFSVNTEQKKITQIDIYTLDPFAINEIVKNKKTLSKDNVSQYIQKCFNKPFFLWSYQHKGFLEPAKYSLNHYNPIIEKWIFE